MKSKSEIEEMYNWLMDELFRLVNKGYEDTNTYLKKDAKKDILEWVLEIGE